FLKFGVRYLIGLIILLRAQRISDGTHRVVAALRRSGVHAEQNEGSERQSAHHAETACGSHLDIPQSDYKTSKKMLVGAVGIEPTTFGLKVCLSQFQLFGISDLRSRCSVVLRLSGLIWGVFR